MLKSYSTSAIISQPLVEVILGQGSRPLKIRSEQHRLKHEQRVRQRKEQTDAAKSLTHELPQDLQRTVQAASEKGASAWLTALPVERHGFALHKGAFQDAIAFRYGWQLQFSPTQCSCGARFEPDHMMTCHQGGYISLRHNELQRYDRKHDG